MTLKVETKPPKSTDVAAERVEPAANWPSAQQSYLSTATAISTEWCHFMSQRLDAYAHVIDDLSHCHDLNEAWRVQSDFGTRTFNAYSNEAARLGGIIVEAANGASKSTH